MNMRGKSQVEIFGPDTLDQINEQIRGYAEGLGLDVEIVHSNIEGEVVNALYDAHERGIDAALINPAGYTTGSRSSCQPSALCTFPGRSVAPSQSPNWLNRKRG